MGMYNYTNDDLIRNSMSFKGFIDLMALLRFIYSEAGLFGSTVVCYRIERIIYIK